MLKAKNKVSVLRYIINKKLTNLTSIYASNIIATKYIPIRKIEHRW